MGKKAKKKKRNPADDLRREPWHVDLKWIFGILAVLCFSITLFSLSIYRVASNPKLIELAKQGNNKNIEEAFSVDELKDGEPYKIKLDNKEYTLEDLQKMSPKEIQKMYEQIMQNNKDGASSGLQGGNNLENQMMKSMISQAVFPAAGRSALAIKGLSMTVLIISFIISLFLITLTIIFSYGYGRLVSLAVILIFSVIPGIVAGLPSIFLSLFSQGSEFAPNGLGPSISSSIYGNLFIYGSIILVSIVLLILALFLRVVATPNNSRRAKKARAKRIEEELKIA